jgi:hypothetical protein
MSYDEFEATMQAAGWALDEIERAWQDHLLDQEIEADETAHLLGLPPFEGDTT